VWAIEYSGTKGLNLYAISYPNQSGFSNFILGDPCSSDGSNCTSNIKKSSAVEISALFFSHTAEQAEVVLIDGFSAATGLKLALGTVSVQDQLGGRTAGNQ
jgi:hypothetical protein